MPPCNRLNFYNHLKIDTHIKLRPAQMDEIILTHYINPEELLWFLSRGFDDAVYRVQGGSVFRVFTVDEEQFLVKITPGNWSVKIEWLYGTPPVEAVALVKNFISEWFDLETDVSPFYELLKTNDKLDYMADAFNGLKLIGMPDLFETLAWAIIGQQINLTFAYKIKRRLVENYGCFIEYHNEVYYTFPSPETIAAAEVADLKAMQLSAGKITYLKNIAAAFCNGTVSKAVLQALPDSASRSNLLTGQKGVGVWTANYALMKCLRDQSAIPYGDAGLLNALMSHGIITNKTELKGMHTLFESFKGWEAYLVFYLWRGLAPKPEIY